jgi:hypothetical protein
MMTIVTIEFLWGTLNRKATINYARDLMKTIQKAAVHRVEAGQAPLREVGRMPVITANHRPA